LTTEQRAKMYDAFGKIARQIEDKNGDKIFRYNNRTHEVELADGRKLPETKKDATEGDRHEIASGYYTESGQSLRRSSFNEFIVDENGNRDIAQISEDVAEQSNGAVKSVPVRLKVGFHSFETRNGKGYRHIAAKHLRSIKAHGFGNAMEFINYTLNNFNKVYKHPTSYKKILLFCDDDSRGFMPLELAKEDDHYTIVTAFPNTNKNINGELVFDGSTTPTTATVDGATEQQEKTSAKKDGDKGGTNPSGANVDTNSPSENIPQSAEDSNTKYSMDASAETERGIFSKARNKFAKAMHLKGDKIVIEEINETRGTNTVAQSNKLLTIFGKSIT